MKLAFRIAWRFLFSSKGQTLLIALGIAVGISVQIFIGSLIEGLQASLIETTIGRSSHITLIANEKNAPVDNATLLESAVDEFDETILEPGAITAISPNISGGAFLKTMDSSEQVLVRGFDFLKANDIYKFGDSLVAGRLPESSDEVLLGLDLTVDFDIELDSAIEIQTSTGKTKDMTVVGIFDFKVASVNQTWVITDIDTARSVFEWDTDSITSIEIQVAQPFDADLIAAQMKDSGEFDAVRIDNWKEQNAQLLSGLSGQSSSSLMIQVFVLISVVLGIASVLAISVLQKSKQIGILKAMGIKDSTTSWIFLFQGMILGIIGGVMGIVLGYGLLYSFTTFALKPDGTPVIPILINVRFMLASGGIAVISATIASLFPARKSKKLSPIEVIKNG